ncbi:hypothetical protein [Variovorax sp.]|uniref:hypothetical protein n=1 Tax=Variovorax sp. TaxID=1871043 RepID=UPI001381D615|nr:hypothetical protein [Variovorax sp.]KAF1060949.1 MAG: hypothetical protein GAK39_06042 [Variovorax sp.]
MKRGQDQPGWWYIKTQMSTGFVMTVQQKDGLANPPIVVAPKLASGFDSQLWSLVPSEKPGYWYIQSRLQANHALNPRVIQFQGTTAAAPATLTELSFDVYTAQVWSFAPVNKG